MGYTHLLNQLLKFYHVSEVYCYYMSLFSLWVVQWSVQEPLSPRLATGYSPEGHWFTCHLHPFHSAPVFGVYNNNDNNNNSSDLGGSRSYVTLWWESLGPMHRWISEKAACTFTRADIAEDGSVCVRLSLELYWQRTQILVSYSCSSILATSYKKWR